MGSLKQLGHKLLAQPDRVVLKPDFNFCFPVLRLVQNQFALEWNLFFLFFISRPFQTPVEKSFHHQATLTDSTSYINRHTGRHLGVIYNNFIIPKFSCRFCGVGFAFDLYKLK